MEAALSKIHKKLHVQAMTKESLTIQKTKASFLVVCKSMSLLALFLYNT